MSSESPRKWAYVLQPWEMEFNAKTQEAMAAARRGETTRVNSIEELIEDD